jgi:putative ABC transport system substrate-binding protein
VKLGLVSSLNRPNANVTGINQFTTLLESKRFGLLHQMVPAANPLAILVNPTGTTVEVQIAEVREAAAQLGVEFVVLKASREPELADAFATLVGKQIAALQVAADPFFFSHRRELVGLAARHKISAIYEWRDFADVGGLMSYGTNLADSYRLAGEYVGRMLRGTKPADLPVTQSTRFEFVINLKTAKTLGIEVPPGLSSMADEMIE